MDGAQNRPPPVKEVKREINSLLGDLPAKGRQQFRSPANGWRHFLEKEAFWVSKFETRLKARSKRLPAGSM